MPSSSVDRSRHTLLVVDDQPVNIQVINQAFAADHRVLKALSGAEALRVCRQHRPDLILLDVVMPEMDGFEVCRRLKADVFTRDIPVIFVTASDDASQETLGLELGAVDFIVKPVNAAVVRARVKTQLAFARSSSLLTATLEASADGILVIDLAGSISSMNGAFARMWGLPPRLYAAGSSEAVYTFMRSQLMSAGEEAPSTDSNDGPMARLVDTVTAFMSLRLVGDRHIERHLTELQVNRTLRGHVLCFRDVTERERAASDLRRLNESLESRILERTKALETATHLAQAASQAKSDFLSNMSHEIRTPMNAVIGLAFLALKTELDAKQRDYLEKIHRSGQHLLGIINDILDFSKIEAGKLILEQTEFLMRSVFESVSCVSAEAAAAKGLDLAFEIDESLSRPLRGDPLRVGQVLMNFVSNAIKFTARGRVHVHASTQQRFESGSLIRIEVEDTGIGLSEAQISQLFQSFHQVDSSTTRNYGGTGLGLAVCKQLAELMHGEVGVRSQPGQGSVFWFTANVGFGAPVGVASSAASALSPQQALECVRGARVLLVEDNLLNQEVSAGLLSDVGVIVGIANHGREALERLAAEHFDCVLMDVQMPVMDGLQATRLIRGNPAWADLPVLAMTANARSEDYARCVEAGMDDFLTKPVMPDRLYAKLAQWLAARRPTVASVTAPAGSADTKASVAAVQAAAAAAPRPGRNPDVIDLDILSRQVGGDATKVRRYGELFVGTLPTSFAEIQDALANGSLPTLADLGHKLKSSARMVGALGLATLCESLESMRTSSSLDEARKVVEQMGPMLDRISSDFTMAMPELQA